MATPFPGDTAPTESQGQETAEVGQLMPGSAEQEAAERKTGEAGQASGEILGLEALGRASGQTLRSSQGGWGQVSGAERESGQRALPGQRCKQVPAEAAARGGQELRSDHSSSSASSERNGRPSAYGLKSNQEVKKGGGDEGGGEEY